MHTYMAAADASSMMRILNGGDVKESGKSTAQMMITRDLLGGCYSSSHISSSLESKELDLDLQVPFGWEKRLDLKSGKVYLQRSNTSSSSNSSSSTSENNSESSREQIDFPHTSKRNTLNLFDEKTLDLKLVSSSSNYPSVCTLDKVKLALERAERESYIRKRSISLISNNSSSPCSNLSSSTKDCGNSNHNEERPSSRDSSFVVGCPSCLMYVLTTTSNPKCPRCNSNVPLPVFVKKPRIDLNIAI